LQVTGPLLAEDPLLPVEAALAAGAAADAAAGALVPLEADLFTPPWPLQAPRPPCGEVVPSLQVTGPLLLEEPVDEEELLPAVAAGAAAAAGAAVLPALLVESPAEADLLMPP
jgi:hypothetical protein